MSEATLRRKPVEGDSAAPSPAAFLGDAITAAMRAVLTDEPDKPVELAPGLYVRASYLVAAVVPEAVARAEAYTRQQVEPQSIRADVVDRVRAYTGGAA